MPAISMQHDPDTGEWSYMAAGRRHVFKVFGYPDCDAWWAWLWRQAPEEAKAWRGDVRGDFNQAVAFIQSGCRCEDCREAVAARHLAEVNARQRAVAAGSRLIEAAAGAVALYVLESSRPVGFAATSDPIAGVTFEGKPTYRDARTRYMETGTIADREVMLACVTLTVPDLDTIGADWEPPAEPAPEPAAAAPKPRVSREAASIAVTAVTAALAIICACTNAILPSPLSVLTFCFIAVAIVLWRKPKARK